MISGSDIQPAFPIISHIGRSGYSGLSIFALPYVYSCVKAHLSIPLAMKKKSDAGPPSRRSLRLAEQARQEMLRQRKLAHGGHEVGDTPEDPLPIPSDEEKEVTPPPPLEARVGSPLNPDYDSDYVEFLTEFLADDSLGDTPPASPATPDTAFPFTPSVAFEVDPPSPPSQTPSMVSTDSPTASV
nr:uncharacterized protein LOC109166971 [Ipomoea trifida]